MKEKTIRLTSLSREELNTLIVDDWGEKPFRAKQLWSWLYVKLVNDVSDMTDLSKLFRAKLEEVCQPLSPTVQSRQMSKDGTEKWLLSFTDGQQVETVYIPEEERGTLCVSSQVGCSLACPFCFTGTQKLVRNLTTSEIVEQVTFARSQVEARGQRLTNIVLMGMGEPLHNYAAVAKAVKIILDSSGLAIGTRKITLSTSGVVPKMVQAGYDLGINLAISLHSVRDDVRDQLVPINKKYNLAALRKGAKEYPLKGNRSITWEYVMLDGINDSPDDARMLVKYLKGIPSKVNLIPFNPWPGTPYKPSSAQKIEEFQNIVGNTGLVTVIRERRGEDIQAACGQLKGERESGDTSSVNS
ncbi:MAG: 23S rRNA (adenine(2503)-C(2))-methyltransferase RlmN [Magnetococcales bacterium]|nr:23S rRNA (adenine(2503)-C(2))-methyltransferase RlmN [Magnetococcales bacterium]